MTIGSPAAELLAGGGLAGFRPDSGLHLASKERLSEPEIEEFALQTTDSETTEEMLLHLDLRPAVARTDGLSRKYVFETLVEQPPRRQRELAENSSIPLAIVFGSEDRFVDADYVTSLHYQNIWSGHPVTMANCGHAPFLHAPDEFNAILRAFISDVAPDGY